MPVNNVLVKDISIEEIKRYAGLAKCQNFSLQSLEQVKQETLLLSQIKGIWQLYDYDPNHGSIIDTLPLTISSNKLIRHLASCEKIVIMAVTIGLAIEQRIQQYFESDEYSTALLLDAAATAMVEAAADQLNNYIIYLAQTRVYKTVYRFSPGYGEWDIAVQHEILKLAQATEIGLTATASSILIPRKSVTAVIGWTASSLKTCRNTCNECSQTNCLSRK